MTDKDMQNQIEFYESERKRRRLRGPEVARLEEYKWALKTKAILS